MICKHCGNNVSDSATICPYCGEVVIVKTKKRNPWLWGILSFLIPIMGIILGFVWRKSDAPIAKTCLIAGIAAICFNILCSTLIPLMF